MGELYLTVYSGINLEKTIEYKKFVKIEYDIRYATIKILCGVYRDICNHTKCSLMGKREKIYWD